MSRWLAGSMLTVVLALTGCAGQGQFADSGFGAAMPPPLPPPPPPPPYVAPRPPQPYIYPTRGQSPQQEESDRGQCYGWAVQQTGFDPANPRVAVAPPPPVYPGQAPSPPVGVFGSAAGGAALGAVGGAIGGNAGEGAAIGAGVGALFGMVRRARFDEEQQQQMQQQQQQQQMYMARQQSALAQGRANYDRAFSACMTGRGYTVN